MIIGGQYSLTLKFDNIEYDLEVSQLEELSIFEDVITSVPTIKLTLVDNKVNQDILPIHDGSVLEVLLQPLSDDEAIQQSLQFRVFTNKAFSQTDSDKIEITGYFDVPNIFKNANFQAINGGSSQAAARIASDSNLVFDGDATNDSQLWLQYGITGGQFLREITRAAYLDDNSAFVSCVTRAGELRFYNIGNRRRNNTIWSFIETDNPALLTDTDQIPIVDSFRDVNSGVLNSWRGYGVYAKEDNLVENIENDIFIENIGKSTDLLNINSTLIEPTKFESGAMNFGNTHKNYFRAQIQNTQILSTFSVGVNILTNVPKDIQLLDRARLLKRSETEVSLKGTESGDYFVDAIATHIYSNALITKYHLIKEGLNTNRSVPDLV